MKKKLICVMLAATIGLMTACGNKTNENVDNAPVSSVEETSTEEGTEEILQENTESTSKEEAVSLNSIYEEITSNVTLVSPMEPSEDFVYNYYGIELNTLDEYVFSVSDEATSAETIIIIKTSDEATINDISEKLEVLKEDMLEELEDYLPEQYDIVNDSKIEISGDYIYLVISENSDEITNIIKKYI